MPIEVIYPHITKVDGQPARLERVPRVRIAQIVMDYRAHGWSVEEMCRQYEYLTISEAHAAMLYYWDHQEEIDREIQDEWARFTRDRAATAPPAFLSRLRSNVAG